MAAHGADIAYGHRPMKEKDGGDTLARIMAERRDKVKALYDERFVTFGEDDVYQQSDAAGFIRLFGLPARVSALKDQQLAASERGSRTNVGAR